MAAGQADRCQRRDTPFFGWWTGSTETVLCPSLNQSKEIGSADMLLLASTPAAGMQSHKPAQEAHWLCDESSACEFLRLQSQPRHPEARCHYKLETLTLKPRILKYRPYEAINPEPSDKNSRPRTVDSRPEVRGTMRFTSRSQACTTLAGFPGGPRMPIIIQRVASIDRIC